MCPIFHVGLRFNFSPSLRVLRTSAPCEMIFLFCKDIAEITVLLEDISRSQNTNCILFVLKNLFCICESSVRDGCDSAPPTIKPGQVSICTISMAVTQLKQDLLCWDLRVTVTQEKFVRSQNLCLPGELGGSGTPLALYFSCLLQELVSKVQVGCLFCKHLQQGKQMFFSTLAF